MTYVFRELAGEAWKCFFSGFLDGIMSYRQEGSTNGVHQQDQICSGRDPLASFCDPKHRLKFHKSEVDDLFRMPLNPEDAGNDSKLSEMTWWNALNVSLNLE